MKNKVSKNQARDIAARLAGVKEGDTVLEAIDKVIKLMRESGLPQSAIRKVEAKRAEYLKRFN